MFRLGVLICLSLTLFISACVKAPVKPENLENNKLIELLKKDHWTFLKIPRADIQPGVIGTVSPENIDILGKLLDCFPSEVIQGLRPEGPFDAAIPYLYREYSFDASAIVVFANYFQISAEYSAFSNFRLQIIGAKASSISVLRIMQYVKDNWGQLKGQYCGDEFRKISTQVVTEVLTAQKFKLTFRDSKGQSVQLKTPDLGKYFAFKAGVNARATEEGGLEFDNPSSLPFAFKSVHFDIPEARGKLEILHPDVHFSKGQNISRADILNSGRAELSWLITKFPDRGFIVENHSGYLQPEQKQPIVVTRNNDCIDPSKPQFLTLLVKNIDQRESIRILAEDSCPTLSGYDQSRLLGTQSSTIILGEQLYREGNFVPALKLLLDGEKSFANIVDMPTYQRLAGLTSFKTGNEFEALKYFKSLARKSSAGHVYAAYLLASKDEFPEAESELNKGENAIQVDPLMIAEIINAFNKPVDGCLIPPSSKAMLYRKEIANSVNKVKSLDGLRFQSVLGEEVAKLAKIDAQVSRAYAVTTFCVVGKKLPRDKVNLLAETVNSIARESLNDREYDVRQKPFLESLEAKLSPSANLKKQFHDLLKEYSTFIAARLDIPQRSIRANIFMLDQNRFLRIPQGLHYNMHDVSEQTIAIPVGFGSTGVAFERMQVTVKRLLSSRRPESQKVSLLWSGSVDEKDNELWDMRNIELPPSEARKAAKNLAWIISAPIFDQRNGAVLGVLNVDCVDREEVYPPSNEEWCMTQRSSDLNRLEVDTYYWSSKLASLLRTE